MARLGKLLAFALAALAAAGWGQSDAGGSRHVRLDSPEAFRTLQTESPGRYRAVQDLIALVARGEEPSSVEMRVRGVSGVKLGPLLLASDPPRRRVRFVLGDTTYSTLVSLEPAPGSGFQRVPGDARSAP